MREHMGLYRGKEINTGLWFQGYYVCLYDSKGNVSHRIYSGYAETDCGDFYPVWFEVDPDTVGECTGLRDKNGKLIFEGDVFKFQDEVWSSCYTSCGTEYNSWEVENYGVVGFCDYEGKFDFVRYKFNENSVEADLHENRDMEFYEFVSELEIIGNIHDNPELLKGGEQ